MAIVSSNSVSLRSFKSFQIVIDPFDTSNSPLCWKRHECTDIVDATSNKTSRNCHFSDCKGAFAVQCGLGCATSADECKKDLYKKITSVAEVAFNIGQIILASTQAPDGNAAPNALAPIGNWIKMVGEGLVKSALSHFLANSVGSDGATSLATQISEKAFGNSSSSVDWSVADPTGVADVVKAFWKPLCPV